MRFNIGLRHGGGQVSFETTMNADQLRQEFETARAGDTLLDFTDARGERALIAPDSIAFLIIPAERETKVGFGRL